ncbi:MAG: hypothetical protein INR62_07875 [Rhodospirillales bacterium]|nr:hypothetical protein [Acetobacter sp.]
MLTNVVALNLGFDVPVKLYSSELLLMAAFLVLPDVPPLWRFFVGKQDAHLSRGRVRRSERRALRLAAHAVQVVTIGWMLYNTGLSAWKLSHEDNTPLSGSWKVDRAGGALAAEGWTGLSTNGKGFLRVSKGLQGEFRKVDVDANGQLLRIFGDTHGPNSNATVPSGILRWKPETQHLLELSGTWQGKPATLVLRRSLRDSKLETRGFHWVQEDPFNR